jgi:hypothetical protein
MHIMCIFQFSLLAAFIWGMEGFSFADLVVESMHCHAWHNVSAYSSCLSILNLPLYHKSHSRFHFSSISFVYELA